MLKTLLKTLLIVLVFLIYGEMTRKKGFDNGLTLGKTRAFREEGYDLSEIHEKLD